MTQQVTAIDSAENKAFTELYALTVQYMQFVQAHKSWVQSEFNFRRPMPVDFIIANDFQLESPAEIRRHKVIKMLGVEIAHFMQNKTWNELEPDEKVLWVNAELAAFRQDFHIYLQSKFEVSYVQ